MRMLLDRNSFLLLMISFRQ